MVVAWNEMTGRVRKDYTGMSYAEREALKRDAWARYRANVPLPEKVAAIEDIIRAHYDRSREAYQGKHPNFFVYACNWVAADVTEREGLLQNHAVRAALEHKYPAPTVRHIPTGKSYWEREPVVGTITVAMQRATAQKKRPPPSPYAALIEDTINRMLHGGRNIRHARQVLSMLLEGTQAPLHCYAVTDIPAWWGNTFWYKVVLCYDRGAVVIDTAHEYYLGSKSDIRSLIRDMALVTYDAVMANWYEQILWEYGRPIAVILLKRWCAQHGKPYRSGETIHQDKQLTQQETTPMSVKLFRDEQGYAIQTEAPSEAIFTTQLTQLLSTLIEEHTYDTHWHQVLRPWIEQAVNICCAYRGYKVEDVEQRTLYTAGRVPAQAVEPTHQVLDETELLAKALQRNGERP